MLKQKVNFSAQHLSIDAGRRDEAIYLTGCPAIGDILLSEWILIFLLIINCRPKDKAIVEHPVYSYHKNFYL